MKKYLVVAAALLLAAGSTAPPARADALNACKSCHTFNKWGKHKAGPNLYHILGRYAGHFEDYRYGSYLKTAYFKWNETKLKAWIMHPAAVAKAAGKATKMPDMHLTAAQADAIIADLKQQG